MKELNCRKSIRMLLAGSLIFLVSGCVAPRSYVSFEILQPASVTFPPDVDTIAYLNRSPVSFRNLARWNHTGLDAIELRMIDTMACNAIKAGFTDGFLSSEVAGIAYADTMLFLEKRRNDTVGKFDTIPSSDLNTIFSLFPVDAVISQDYYYIELSESNNYDFSLLDYVQRFSFLIDVGWRIYTRNDTLPFHSYRYRDTLFFENYASMPSSEYVTGTDVIRIGLYEAGYNYGYRNVPVWQEISRFIYRGREEPLRRAAILTDDGRWEEAKEIWQATLDAGDAQLAAKSAVNLAVYHELGDDLERSLELLKLAREKWDDDAVEWYYEDMKIRLENRKELKKQFR